MEVLTKLAAHLHEQLIDISEVQAKLRSGLDHPYGSVQSDMDRLFDIRTEKLRRLSRFMCNDAVTTFIDYYRFNSTEDDLEHRSVSALERARMACTGLLDAANDTNVMGDDTDMNDLSDRVDEATGLAAWACVSSRVHSAEQQACGQYYCQGPQGMCIPTCGRTQ